MVEEFGDVVTYPELGNTYVFAQVWPSWAYAVDALGLKNVTTCVTWLSARAREEFKGTSMGSTLANMTTVTSRLADERASSNLKRPLLFIQGTPSFISSILPLFDGIDCYSICAMAVRPQSALRPSDVAHIPHLHWRQVSHRSLAGVTDGTWMFGSSIDLAPFGGVTRSPLRRTLGDIVSHTVSSSVLFDDLAPPRTHYRDRRLYHMDSRAPFGVHSFPLVAPSVYTPNKSLIVREVTLCELMCAYDIECRTQRELFSFWEEEDADPTHDFTRQAPVKVLYSTSRQVLGALLARAMSVRADSDSSSSTNDGISVPDLHLQSELGDLGGSVSAPADASGLSDSSGLPPESSDVINLTDNVGSAVGVVRGLGVDDGSAVGSAVGEVSGLDSAVGSAVGEVSGLDVGSAVGDVDGVGVGVDVGVEFGSAVGSAVGDVSGFSSGSAVGPAVGSAVGDVSGSGIAAGVAVPPPVGGDESNVNDSSLPPSSFGMEPDPSQISEADVKAAKNDDAKVNVDDWNSWTLHSFVPTCPSERPLICIPGAVTDLHRKSFDIIRKGLLYAWKRRLLRGFRAHLNRTRDRSRLVPFSTHYRVLNDGGGGGKWRTIYVTTRVSPWCLSPLSRKPVRKRRRSQSSIRATELRRDLEQGADCLSRAGHCTFWEWPDGSSIFFWRWPPRYHKALRDGTKLWICGQLPEWRRPQRLPTDPSTRDKLLSKLQVPRSKRYITRGFVKSRTGYFDVPKGTDDIRIVYDATACGLNKALWSPNFYLPTIDALLRHADDNTYYGDIDLGEMFLNYALDEALRPYAGVDVSALEPDRIRGDVKAVIERWERTLMGLRPSPYVCTQAFSWSEEVIRGERLAKNNPLRWDKVVLNLPGDSAYNPSLPWVYKWNSETNSLASYFGTYVDDVRTQGHSEASCRSTTRRVASGVGYLGQQDAPRKRRPPVKRPGAWSGAMCFSVEGEGLYVSCSKEKWLKGKNLVEELFQDVVVEGKTHLERSRLEKNVGFLVHLSRTYPALFPYFKGIYLTMESWREGRDSEGWKFSRKGWWNLMAGACEDEDENGNLDSMTFEEKKRIFLKKNQGPRPSQVPIVKRLARDLTALRSLFNHDLPPKRLVRGKKLQEAMYGFGDASGGGFGSSWERKGGTRYRAGVWGSDMDASSSNHRELRNLVDSLKAMESEGTLPGTEAFIFTDNSTAESAFFKGTSSSSLLFELVLELRQLEMRAGCKVHIIHVAGTRMIAQGSDGLSRGNFTEGSMRGDKILDYVPIASSALERSPALVDWLKSWASDNLEFLDPTGWFERGHDLTPNGDRNVEGHWIPSFQSGNFVWSPPPAAAEVAVEELRRARHKRQDSHHIFIVPRLMQPYWYKHLCKVADIILTLPVGHPAWPVDMYEPLTIGICFPYLNHRPWELKRAPILLELGRKLHGLWKEDVLSEGPLLRELWDVQRKLACMPAFMASKMLQGVHASSIQSCTSRKRRRDQVEEKEG